MVWGGLDWWIYYAYNGNGALASKTSNNVVLNYSPNALGQATRAGTFATGALYFPNGALKQFTYGNGIVHTLTQNVRQLPDTSRDAYGAKEYLDDGYDYDANGNVAAISDGLPEAHGNRTMTYDGLDRLKTTVSPMYGSTVATYSYDVLDNLRTVKAPGRDHTYVYDGTQRLTNVTETIGGASVIGLDYDLQGNLSQKNSQDFDFDFGNRLRSVTAPGSIPSTYIYDGHGRRVGDITGGAKYSLYSQTGELTFVRDMRKRKRYDYVNLAGSLVAIRTQDMDSNTYSTSYQHTDALGSPVVVTDSARVEVERSDYEPYGKLLNRPVKDGPGYTGHVEDAAIRMTYMQQRYYDAAIGRFLSVDPVTADGNTGGNFNRYWYAANNPYKFTDPDGRIIKNNHEPKGSAPGCKLNGSMCYRSTCERANACFGNGGVSEGVRSSGPAGDIGSGRGTAAPSKQEQITSAIKYFAIDMHGANVSYQAMNLEGTVVGTDVIEVGDGAFSSFAHLGSVIGHEVIHIVQNQRKLYFSGDWGANLAEAQADRFQILNVERFGSSAKEAARYRAQFEEHTRGMPEQYRRRLDDVDDAF